MRNDFIANDYVMIMSHDVYEYLQSVVHVRTAAAGVCNRRLKDHCVVNRERF